MKFNYGPTSAKKNQTEFKYKGYSFAIDKSAKTNVMTKRNQTAAPSSRVEELALKKTTSTSVSDKE